MKERNEGDSQSDAYFGKYERGRKGESKITRENRLHVENTFIARLRINPR